LEFWACEKPVLGQSILGPKIHFAQYSWAFEQFDRLAPVTFQDQAGWSPRLPSRRSIEAAARYPGDDFSSLLEGKGKDRIVGIGAIHHQHIALLGVAPEVIKEQFLFALSFA
jgi:hypothetical protein